MEASSSRQSEKDPTGKTGGDDCDVIASPDVLRENRLPPGQVLTAIDSLTGVAKWPVLDASGPPDIDMDKWRLRLFGEVEREVELDWALLMQLPFVRVRCDIHCVTTWSRLDNLFEGPSTRTIVDQVHPKPDARFVLVYAYDKVGGDWSTNLCLDDFVAEDCLLAVRHDGQPLSTEHGGPCRLVVPRRYFWKSAKWIKAIRFIREDQPGFWERNGYHMRGDPWREERYRPL